MEQAKKLRAVLRSAFTRTANQLDGLLTMVEANPQDIEVAWKMLQRKSDDLHVADKELFNLLLESNATEEELTNEICNSDEYSAKFTKYRILCEKMKANDQANFSVNIHADGSETNLASSSTYRKYRLPKIEFKKFGGEMLDWLAFWSQFKKIHEDNDLAPEDKFQYLLQSTLPGTRARDLVESYPPTGDNYNTAIQSLKSRFGRDDMLVEVYVRELLKLVLHNAVSKISKDEISTVYDRLETQIRALEILGVTTDKCAAMLYPLVESSLPEELLRVWQRTQTFSNGQSSTLKSRLEGLMLFLRSEVENEARISLATEGFGIRSLDKNQNKERKPKAAHQNIPTASGLMNCQTEKCIFCDGAHRSENCFKAQDMTLVQKRNMITEKKACFSCLKIGHQSRKCKERLRCHICSRRHVVLVCPELSINKASDRQVGKYKCQDEKTVEVDKTLSNQTDTKVFLQTLRIKLRNELCEREVRAIIDSGSQRSYILQSTATTMRYAVKRKEAIIHALFGGCNSTEQTHICYDARLSSLDGKYACRFEVLDQPVICQNISPIYEGTWTTELKRLNISLTDVHTCDPIEVLIGADVAGKLLTGRRRVLRCGLVAVETFLGWTLMGKVPGQIKRSSTAMTAISLLTKDAMLTDLWQLDVLGITDPAEKKSTREIEAAASEHFLRTIEVDAEGRYQVCLPWFDNHPPLPNNYAIARKRLDNVYRKLSKDEMYDDYERVFVEWEQEGIIEPVDDVEPKSLSHYLPHHPVVKLSSATTKIRPVFDASAHDKGQPALNHCLEKGPNLIELIFSVLIRFRLYEIGVVSDIRKAFLQISLQEKHRDFLRFLWKRKDGSLQIFRHKRVVFGVCCSPFLLGATIKYHLNKLIQRTRSSDDKYSEYTVMKLKDAFYVDNCVTSVTDETELDTFMQEASQLMAEGMFDLRGWEFTSRNSSEPPPECTPVLRMAWDRIYDTLKLCDVSESNIGAEKLTKRIILSQAQRLFDPSDLVALTPAMFLRDRPEIGVLDLDKIESNDFCRRIRYCQKLREDLRHRFRSEYLGQLKQVCGKKCARPISVGEIVLIGYDNVKRID